MTNELRSELRKHILTSLRVERMDVGQHVPEKTFAAFGTSRGPIRAALAELARDGILEYRSNRGYFIADLDGVTTQDAPGEEERVYRAIAADRLAGDIGETVTANEVMRRYEVTRSVVLRVFGRIEREGWAERRAGRGWTFTAMVDTVDAYREIYEVRRAIEPAGILADAYRADKPTLVTCRERQDFILDRGLTTLDQGELFAIQTDFHVKVMEMSGNRFFVQTLLRLNSLRRLATYRQERDRDRVEMQCRQHVAILDALLDDDRRTAAELMRAHLGGSDRESLALDIFDGRRPGNSR
ncbi:GntR family transcriptional regulator [Aureimonas frigidaquae]|uniref:GntR family transcriptional regulator n=1 Tax=Aureimonas frigidaquae TaxID=424757 RepID=A0A0P0Z3M7_9HYPH|nr:GntR family transcriptional regulator [Aureimonas frigidaquae]BAT28675.1 GntR family transcriptional regulator [Aureimonas frigidaquae]